MPLPQPRDYVPFSAGPFRMAMGLQPLAPEQWLELDSSYPQELSRKQSLLAQQHEAVFAAEPGSASGGAEVLELVASHLAQHHSEFFSRDGSVVRNALTGETWELGKLNCHPLEAAARLVQEDLCLMQERGDAYCLTAACVCFPSRWKLREKIGAPMREIHAPVPFYEKIGAATDRFMTLLTPDKPVGRINWSLHDSPELFQPVKAPPAAPGPITGENAGERLWLRAERQTLRRLPSSGAILFTIRTYVRPLSDFSSPPRAQDLASALRNLPTETAAYKSVLDCREAAIGYLERQ
ncbi:MAG TPA: DUF3445 domain-containing protein [Planctomycetota bacterium]|nr:DUF3445 domain-containing protein [Planctomycetota bacterium]